MMIEIIPYEQLRIQYFQEQIEKLRRSLTYYTRKMNKLGDQHSSHQIMDLHYKASEIGMKISFYQDAINALGVSQ